MTKFLTLTEIRKMAVGKNIRFSNKLSKAELVKKLNLDEKVCKKPSNVSNASNAMEVLITNVDTQVVTKCKSIYQCAKVLGKSYGSTHYFVNCGNAFVDKDGNKVRLSFFK